MGVSFLYFYKLLIHISSLKSVKKKKRKKKEPPQKVTGSIVYSLGLFIAHLVLVSVVGDIINDSLLAMDNKETVATIKDCRMSRGTEYCVYSYEVDDSYYEIKYCNSSENLKLKESDTTKVIYYSKFPVISRLKKELKD